MHIRPTTLSDLETVLYLYQQARTFMREHGNPTQWGDSYPQRELVEEDIRAGKSYICEEEGEVLATFYFAKEADPDYAQIYEGAWLGNGPYGVMHRLASSSGRKGTASFCLNWCFKQSGGDLRIDTHADNLPMQGMLAKNGFSRCGIVHCAYGGDRIGFEKVDICSQAQYS